MKRFLLLQHLCFFLTFSGYAQIQTSNVQTRSFQGVVYSEESGEKLVGVQFVNPNTRSIVALSDVQGLFDFSLNGDSVILHHTGYSEKKIHFSEREIFLTPDVDLLNTIVVSESRSARKLKYSTLSLEVIKPELIAHTSPTSMEESIGRINGVQVVDNQPNIRSGSGWSYGVGSRVQVMVDDMPMLSGDANQPLWNFIPTEGVEGIEIIKGASSVIYGSSALNGVINIKMRKPKAEPYSKLSLSAGAYDLPARSSLLYQGNQRNTLSNFTLYHSAMHRGLGITASVNGLYDQGYKMSDHDKRLRANVGLRKSFGEKNLVVGLNAGFQKGNSGSFLLWKSYDSGYNTLNDQVTESNSTRFVLDPYVKWVRGKYTHSLNLRYLGVDNNIDNGDPTVDQSNRSNMVYSEYRSGFTLDKLKLNVLGGIVANASNTSSPLFDGDHTSNNIAAYLQFDRSWNRLTANVGARYEHFTLDSRSEGKPVIRAGLNYQLASYTFLRASYGQGYRFPSIAESFVSTSVNAVSIFQNPNLRSETGTNMEFGVKQGFKVKNMGFMLDGAIFQMTFSNMMEFTFGQWNQTASGIGFKTLNTGDTRIRGAELNLGFEQKTKRAKLQGFVGYTLTNSKALEPDRVIGTDARGIELTYRNTSSNSEGDVLKYRPQHQAKADIMVEFGKWSIGAGLALQSEVQNIDTAFIAFPISLLVPGVQRSWEEGHSAYVLLNARIQYEISSKWSLQLISFNLTNREYVIRPADIGSPRSVRFQVNYFLGK